LQFQVPKYIDIEDKVFGPLTFKQFVYLLGGAGLAVIILWLVPVTIIAIPLMGLAIMFSLALAFYEVNGKPFIHTVQAALSYATSPRTYIWKQRDHKDMSKKQLEKNLRQIEAVMDESQAGRLQEKSTDISVGKEGQNIEDLSATNNNVE
jgi:hypothetical protein